MSYVPTLKKHYKEEVIPQLMEKFQYKSIMEVPKIVKVSLNRGVGGATQDKKLVDHALSELTMITGQKAIPCPARNSISNFKLREGMIIGAKVTLRRNRMYEFLDRFVNVALPRVRDFRGINDKSFDGRGNYSIGIKEQIIFPEINLDKVNAITGLDISIVTTAKTDVEALELLKLMGLPFKNQRN